MKPRPGMPRRRRHQKPPAPSPIAASLARTPQQQQLPLNRPRITINRNAQTSAWVAGIADDANRCDGTRCATPNISKGDTVIAFLDGDRVIRKVYCTACADKLFATGEGAPA